MRTPEAPPDPEGSDSAHPAGDDPRFSGPFRLGALAAAIVAALGIVLFLHLSAYVANRYHVPVGNDAPQYLARARIAASGGLDALARAFPPPLTANPDRPAYPVLANLLHATTGIRPEQLAFTFSAVISVVIGLAAAAFARAAMEEPAWSFPVYVVLIGASTSTVLTAIGHIDNLMVDALLLTGAATAVLVAGGRPAMTAAVLLFAATAIVHWSFGLLFALVMVVFAAALIPASLGDLRRGGSIMDTPSARLTGVLAGSVALGGLLLLPGVSPPNVVRLPRSQVAVDFRRTSAKFGWAVQAPLAAVGTAALLWLHPSRIRRFALVLLLVWAGVGLGAVVLFELGSPVPAHRLLPFAFGIPLLAAAGVVGVGRFVGGRGGTAGRAVGAAVVVAGLVASGVMAFRILSTRTPFLDDGALSQTATAANYATMLAGGRPVVLVVSRPDQGAATLFGVAPAYRWTSSWMPVDERSRLYVYLGTLADLQRRRPARSGDRSFDETSATLWNTDRRVMGSRPVFVTLRAFNGAFGRFVAGDPATRVAPGVAVRGGPVPASGTIPVPALPAPPRTPSLFGLALLQLAALAVAGLGWSASLVPTRWLERTAFAPTFGIAVWSIGGYVADRLGFRLAGGAGLAVGLVVALLGWGPFLVRSVAAHRRPVPGVGPVERRSDAALVGPGDEGRGA
ncbi:MAG TPA: hypothetical protein VID47_15055 [Actinomycetota bacterium]